MGRKHRIRVTKEELERYERSLRKPRGMETPLASTTQAMEYLGPLKQPKRIRAPSAERRKPRATRPMTPRTAARRARLVANKSPMREAGPRGYLCEVPSSARGREIVARRRAAARKDLPGFDDSRRQAERTLSATVRRRSAGSAGHSRAPLWALAQRPASAAAASTQPTAIPWDRATLPPAPSTCSLRPQRSMIDEGDREARLVLRESLEAASRQRLLTTMASDPRPFTAPAAPTLRTRVSPERSKHENPRPSSAAGSPDRGIGPAEDAAVQTPASMLGHHDEHGAVMLEIIRAEGIDAVAVSSTLQGNDIAKQEHLEPDGCESSTLDPEKMKSHCRVALESSTWVTPVALGYRPEWSHLKTTFVADIESCIVLDVLSSREDTHDLVNDAQFHSNVGIRVSSLPAGSSERWYPLLPYTGECIPIDVGDSEPSEGVPRVLLRTQFSVRAANTQAEVPVLHKQLHAHHLALETAAQGAAGHLSVKILGGRNLGFTFAEGTTTATTTTASTPQDSFPVIEYDGTTTRPGPVVFGASQPQWDMSAGPFNVAPAKSESDQGAPLVIRIHKWRSLHNSSACSAAYELFGVASIDVRHAIHKWSHAPTMQQELDAIVVEAWVALHSWASPDDTVLVDGSCHPSAWHNPHRRLDPSGEVLVRLTFKQSKVARVPRPLPYHSTLQVTLCQCHRIMGNLQSSVRVELSMHNSAHLASRKPPFPATCETWSTRVVDEMFSPTFFETFSFPLQCGTACLRLDVYEISQGKPSQSLHGDGSPTKSMSRPPSRNSPQRRSDPDFTDAENSSAVPSPSKIVKQKLLCSAVVPFMRLLSTTARHWYKLLPEESITHKMHSRNVDKWLNAENIQKVKHQESLKVELPHGAIQFSAKISGDEATSGEAAKIVSTYARRHGSSMRHHARVTIKQISVEGLPKVQATGRTGTGTKKLIEPSPMVRFSFGQTSRQTSAHKRTHEASWEDVLHLPFSWLDDGDGDPEPEELEAEMKTHGGVTCKVYHRASPNATVREQLIGSATLSLTELVSRGGQHTSPGPCTYTIFNTVGHGVRQLRATGRITLEATVEIQGKDQLEPGQQWDEFDDEEDSTEVRGSHHLAQPHTQLHYMLRTATSMRSIPIVTIDPELLDEKSALSKQTSCIGGQQGQLVLADEATTLTSLQLTIHSMQGIPETVTSPVCRVYVTSGGHSTQSGHHRSPRSGSVLRPSVASSSSVEDNAFLLSPETIGQLSIEQTVTFNLPRFMLETESEPTFTNAFDATIPWSSEMPEDRMLVVEVFENVGALESEVILGSLFGRVSLSVDQASELQEQGQKWHRLSVASGASFEDQQEQQHDEDDEGLIGIPALQLSLTIANTSAVVAPHVIAAAIRVPPPSRSEFLDMDDKQEAATTGEHEEAAVTNRLGHSKLYHGARNNVRVFYDTADLTRLDDVNEIEQILLDAKEIWSRHRHYEYEVEDLGPIVMEVFAKLKRENLNEEWTKKATENLSQWIHLYKGGILSHWTFKHFCAFWRQVIEDTVSYAIHLGEAFRDFYCRSVAAERFAELDVDGSGFLEGEERTAMIGWILGFLYGENPPASVQREMEAEVRHFQMRLDIDGDSRITFDELHQYIFDHIKWMESLRERQALAQEAAKERATAILQSAARGWLQRRALRNLLMRSIPRDCQDAMLFINHIPLKDAQPYKIRSFALKYWGATRAVSVRSKDDSDSSKSKDEDAGRCWAILWLESKDKAALALESQEEAIAANRQHFQVTDHGPRQFHIQKCDLVRLHSKKAIGVLSEIWRAVPMAVVKNIPNAVADEKKLKDIVAQCGAVDAIVLEKMDGDESWALVTFRYERSILKAIAQPIEVGVNFIVLHRATFQQVVKMNGITVVRQRGWSTEHESTRTGLTGAMAGLKGARGGASAGKDVRETAEEVAARLNRSFKTNPANVERIVDRQTATPPELATKTKARQTKGNKTNSFDTYYDPSNNLRQGGRGDVFYKVVWQGRFVDASWVTQDMLLQTAVTRGMVYEYEDNLAEKKRMELEILHRN